MTYSRKRLALIALIVVSLALIAGLVYSLNIKENPSTELKEVKQDTLKDTVTPLEDTDATVNMLITEIEAIKIPLNAEGDGALDTSIVDIMEQNIVSLGESSKEQGVTRYQLADTLYNIISSNNKLPNLYGYQVDYTDASDIPSRYLTAVACVKYLELVNYGPELKGYTYVTKEELASSMVKCRNYMDTYVKSDDTQDNIESNTKKPEIKEVEEKAAEILKERTVEDRLNGQSIALFKNPKTLGEIRSNIDNITISDAYTEAGIGTGDKLNNEYINMDEGLVDYSMLGAENIVGLTRSQMLKFRVTTRDTGNIVLYSKELEDAYVNRLMGFTSVVGIRDNSVVSIGEYIADSAYGFEIELPLKDIDSIGIITSKAILDNSITFDNDTKSESVLVLVPLDIRDIRTIAKLGGN